MPGILLAMFLSLVTGAVLDNSQPAVHKEVKEFLLPNN